MKLFLAFFKLIRWPNLFFIALTQALLYFIVFHVPGSTDHSLFYGIVAASVLIAAAGYIINDYFDLQIDTINKPQKVVVDKIIKRRWTIVWHWVLSGAGILISAFIALKTGLWIILWANIGCVFLLWVYSTTFKKRLLSGNLIIAALTAWVVFVVYFYAMYLLKLNSSVASNANSFLKLTILYAGYAFIVSLIREVIKDMEDVQGDLAHHCKTMPIVWGIPASKVFAGVWIVVAICGLLIVQVFAWQTDGWWILLYSVALVIIPLALVLRKLYQAKTTKDYHQLSSWMKFIMLTGILSMFFFY